jgi:hypothetical protein
MNDEVIVHEDEVQFFTRKNLRRNRPLIGLAVLLGFVYVSFVGLENPVPRAAAFIPVLVLLVVYVVYRLPQYLEPQPCLVIDRTGLMDTTTWAGMGRVEWSEIGIVCSYIRGRFSGLEFSPLDPDTFLARRPWYLRMTFMMNGWFGFPKYFIPCISLSEPPEKVVERIEQFRASETEVGKTEP